MLQNRDTQRVNRGNKAIQASLVSQLNVEVLKHLEKLPMSDSVKYTKTKLVNLASKTNAMLLERFNKSQTSINKTTCEKYASVQHSLISRAIRYNEDLTQVSGLSSYVIDEDIVSTYNELKTLSQSGKLPYTVTYSFSICVI